MEVIREFFKNAVEVKNFGLNLTTLSAGITLALSSYQMWGVTTQISTIRKEKSADMISMPLFIFVLFYLATTIMYGVYVNKLSIIYNGTNVFFYLATLFVIWKFKPVSRGDMFFLLLFSLMIPLMIIVPDKKIAYMSCASIMLMAMSSQLILLIKHKRKGSLEPKLIRVYLISNSSWLIYGIITKDWVLQLSNSISLTLIIFILILLRRYKDG